MEDWFASAPKKIAPVSRSADEQAAVDELTARMALYHYDSCMFCARVRHVIAALTLKIGARDVLRDAKHRDALRAGGGRTTVPCLRIDGVAGEPTTWMYESSDIIRYLNERFGHTAR